MGSEPQAPVVGGGSSILLVDCPDQRGIVAAVSDFLYRRGANILHADQHQDSELGLFFTRVEWADEGFELPPDRFAAEFQPVADRFGMRWRVEHTGRPQRMAIFVSHYLHCLVDLLHRHATGELPCAIPVIISNHEDGRAIAEFHRIPFISFEVSAQDKPQVEERQLAILAEHEIDLIVLARYMQVLSPSFVARYAGRIINVHHSFLPAFTGARPYHAAFHRGVKLIGATSHYVTAVLDDGPIIEQDVARVSHRDRLSDFIEKGRDLERVVLARAVRWHLEHRILSYANKTVVFD